jgi:hypothetical protein
MQLVFVHTKSNVWLLWIMLLDDRNPHLVTAPPQHLARTPFRVALMHRAGPQNQRPVLGSYQAHEPR